MPEHQVVAILKFNGQIVETFFIKQTIPSIAVAAPEYTAEPWRVELDKPPTIALYKMMFDYERTLYTDPIKGITYAEYTFRGIEK